MLDIGQPFEATEVVTTANVAYLKVGGTNGWAFHVGVSGKWVGQPIVERLEVSSATEEERAAQSEERAAEARDAASEAACDPKGPEEMALVSFLTWAKSQKQMKVHPGLTFRGGDLIVSLPVSKDTPLVGVMRELLLFADSAAAPPATEEPAYAELLQAASSSGLPVPELQLALRLLTEMKDWKGSPWQAYQKSLPERAAAPSLWSVEQVSELQYPTLRERVKDEKAKRVAFFDAHLKDTSVLGGSVQLDEFLTALAAVELRAFEAEPAKPVMIPLVDLVGPPEAQAPAGGEVPEPNCRLVMEGEGAEAIPILYAARDLQPGDVLTRSIGEALSLEDFFCKHGLGRTGGRDECVDVRVTLEEGSMTDWQLAAVKRITQVGLGKLPGDHVFSGQVRRSDDLAGAISPSILSVARVLTCTSEEEMEVLVGDATDASVEAGDSLGLAGLYGEKRNICVDKLIKMVRSCRGEFATTVDEDVKLLPTAKGNRRTAAALRIEKKLVLEEVLSLLEREREAEPEDAGHLPFAVTGILP